MNRRSLAHHSPLQKASEIKVVGVGGAGCNVVNRLIEANFMGAQMVVMSTDDLYLHHSQAHAKILLGPHLCQGLGVRGDLERADAAFSESAPKILAALEGVRFVIVVAGMGGGTGTQGALRVAESARQLGLFTIAMVLMPFDWEGKRKHLRAKGGVEALRKNAHTVFVVNQDVSALPPQLGSLTMSELYHAAEQILIHGLKALVGLLSIPDPRVKDIAQAQTLLAHGGLARIRIGEGRGKDGALKALREALMSPLLQGSPYESKNILICILKGRKLGESKPDETFLGMAHQHYQGQGQITICTLEASDLERENHTLVTILEFSEDTTGSCQGS